MHWDTLKQGNHSTVRGDGGCRVGEVRAGTTSTMPEHKGFMLPNHTSSLRVKRLFIHNCTASDFVNTLQEVANA